MTRLVVLNILLVLALALTACTGSPTKKVTAKATPFDEKLFSAGAVAISRGDRGIGLALLTSLIHDYPKSPMSEQAKLLVFYSLAQGDRDKDGKKNALLNEILKI